MLRNDYINKIKELTEDLPTEKGILYFQDSKGKILYRSYVDDLRKSAKKIFNSKSKRWEEVQKNVNQIKYELTGTEVIAKLMMGLKGEKIIQDTPFGLFLKGETLFVDRISKIEQKPIVEFKTFSQGMKALNHINSTEDLKNVQDLKKYICLRNKNQLLISKGREMGEKSFLVLENGKLTGYGFYNLYHQIQSMHKIQKLKVKTSKGKDVENDIKLGILKGIYALQNLPE